MLNLTRSELRLIAKDISIDEYQNMSKQQFKIHLMKRPHLSQDLQKRIFTPTSRPVKRTRTPALINMNEFEKSKRAKRQTISRRYLVWRVRLVN